MLGLKCQKLLEKLFLKPLKNSTMFRCQIWNPNVAWRRKIAQLLTEKLRSCLGYRLWIRHDNSRLKKFCDWPSKICLENDLEIFQRILRCKYLIEKFLAEYWWVINYWILIFLQGTSISSSIQWKASDSWRHKECKYSARHMLWA